MTVVSVYEAKTHLSRLLRRVRSGEEIEISVSGRSVARLSPVVLAAGPRTLGGDEGQVWEADDFNAPLPAALLDSFYEGPAPRVVTRKQPARRKLKPRQP